MPSSNVPKIQFVPTGVVLPEEADILAGVQADQAAAFGGNLSTSLSSPQGQLAQSSTAIIGDKNNEILNIVNQVNPDTSSGRWQDAIGRIYFLDRIAATGTVVQATCAGLVGATIPAGSLAQDVNGYKYASLADATIGASGTATVSFQCLTTGPIQCPTGALNVIFKAVTGWETVTNLSAGVVGNDVESRADFEFRRRNSVAANAVNSPQAIYGAVLGVEGVLDAYVIDNPLATVADTGSTNYPVAANSVYVAVVGGTAADIAKAIWSKKSLGCNYNGTTTYVVEDDNYASPKPQYTVKWVTPAALPIFFKVTIVNNPNMVSNVSDLIKAAIVDAFAGVDGGSRARIGATLYAGRYYPGIAGTDPNVEILSVTLGTATNPTGTSLTVGIDQAPTLDSANIQVVLS
jgi:uncharacterized phage protein gp47/JayE